MLLYLTSSEPSNSSYCNQDGEVLFKSVCPYKAKKRVAVIWHALPSLKSTPADTLWAERHFGVCSSARATLQDDLSPHIEDSEDYGGRQSFESHDHDFHWENPVPSFEDFQKVAIETEPQTSFTKVADIEFHSISSTKIRYQEKEWKTNDLFKKEGWAWYGGNRIFTGPDGKEYKWKMGESISELFLQNMDSKEEHHRIAHVPFLIARFCSPRDGVLHDEKSPAYLEIFPKGEHMVQLILITFIYIEEMRRQRQRSTNTESEDA